MAGVIKIILQITRALRRQKAYPITLKTKEMGDPGTKVYKGGMGNSMQKGGAGDKSSSRKCAYANSAQHLAVVREWGS